MAGFPVRTRYVCRRCIAQIHHRPISGPALRLPRQWRAYADHAPEKSAESSSLDELIAASEPSGRRRGDTITEASFRLAKHFNRDPKLTRARNMRATNAALRVKLDDGNRMNYSRHRNPTSAPRTRPVRKVESTDQKSEAVPEPEHSTLTDWLPQEPPTHIKLPSVRLDDCSWYWQTLAPTVAQKAQASQFFVGGAAPKFLQSVALFRAFPDSDVPEVAFVGRSNVGKSSLLNAIVNANTKALLAKTSSTPGFTKTMNLYGVGPGNGVNIVKTPEGHGKVVGKGGITIVDMPGYGEGSLTEWGNEIMKYLQGRKQLRRVFVLIDAQHGIKDKDRSILASLRLGGVPHQVILSKLDKIFIPKASNIQRADGKKMSKLKSKGSLDALQVTMETIQNEIQPPVGGGALGEIIGCSSEIVVDKKRLGIDAVRFAICQACGLHFKTRHVLV